MSPAPLLPMLASLLDALLDAPNLAYEPKYDGIRAIVEVSKRDVRIWSRLGNDKTTQFPEIVEALRGWARRLKAPIVLDGEIVALDAKGIPARFQQLQARIHVWDADEAPSGVRVAFIAFDLLRNGRTDLRERLGRAHRQGCRLALQGRQAHPRLAQAEDRAGTGIRRRRLDRAPPVARVCRHPPARGVRDTQPIQPIPNP